MLMENRSETKRNAAVSCAACLRMVIAASEEVYHDHFSGTEYRSYSCPDCGTVFASPAEAVGPDWYANLPLEPIVPANRDWRFKMFLQDRLAPDKLLDIGCGLGEFLLWVREHGYDACVGLDQDERKVQKVRAAGVKIYVDDWDNFCRSRDEGEFGIVTLFDVLEHMPQPTALLRGIKRLLRPGGALVITVPNADRPLPFGREVWDFPPLHFTRWSPKAMRTLLEREGFSIVRQDASMLELRYFLDVMVMHCAIEPLLALAKKWMFRGETANGRTVTELMSDSNAAAESKSWLQRVFGSKRLRAFLFSSFRFIAKVVLWPVAVCLALYYRATRADCGNCLYTLARKDAQA